MQLAYFQVFIPTCLLLLIGTPAHVEPAKILFLIPMSTRSEKHMFSPLITKLASNGHNLTVVTNIADKVGHANVTEIVPISVDEVCGSVSDIGASQSLFWDIVFLDMKPLMSLVDKIYDHPEFKTVLRQKFDLIFTNLFFGQAFYGVMYKNRGPFILLHSLPVANYFLKDWGHVAPPSHVPYPLLEFTDKMNFRERVVNFLVDWATYFHSEMVDIPLFEEVYRKHLGREVPSVKEIQKNASLMMMNTNYLTTYHRPVMPDVIEIGGMHCKEAKPLPEV
ncbi:UDP-glucuronosyltransferase 2B7 [Folsomia candida]|uniref:UDP-glucuronosyltransferase 2B7 n=1 Tax=Folsomia candida TaxID=158441 RepID=A0A226DKR0_FOLCA|nr:UDP-glucuronosyltransferase 2B7 [Folsomia candida]